MTLSITFHGAAKTVTGSCMLVKIDGRQILIDCGLFQGNKTLKELNYQNFPFDISSLDAVLVTHAHIDHSGLLPKLRLAGYSGKIFATQGTADLLACLLPDSGGIQEMEVKQLNRRNSARGRKSVEAIYGRADGEETADSLTVVKADTWITLAPGIRARFWRAGHILGAASIELEGGGTRALFSGDIGSFIHGIEGAPAGPSDLDLVVMEGTYGDRIREPQDRTQRAAALFAEVQRALQAGGNLIIPAFAVERTQELMLDLLSMDRDKLPNHQIFLDSPLAAKATEVFAAHSGNGDFDLAKRGVRVVASTEESMALAQITQGAIIVSASGMCDAGRVREHLRDNLWRPSSTVLLVGYMAPGTLGAMLKDGKKRVRIRGQEIDVRCAIRTLDSYSGHADQNELLDWVKARMPVKHQLVLNHGEEQALATLSGLIESRFNIPVLVPNLDQTILRRDDESFYLGPISAGRLTENDRQTAVSGWDWHNDYADFLVSLQERLEQQAGRPNQQRLLRKLKKALAEDE